jgi:hypothetical protein
VSCWRVVSGAEPGDVNQSVLRHRRFALLPKHRVLRLGCLTQISQDVLSVCGLLTRGLGVRRAHVDVFHEPIFDAGSHRGDRKIASEGDRRRNRESVSSYINRFQQLSHLLARGASCSSIPQLEAPHNTRTPRTSAILVIVSGYWPEFLTCGGLSHFTCPPASLTLLETHAQNQWRDYD